MKDPELWLAVMFEFYCGLRPGHEIREMKIKDLDLVAGTVRVTRERAKNTLYVRGAHDNTAHELPKRRLEEQKIEKKLILIVRHLHRIRVTTLEIFVVRFHL